MKNNVLEFINKSEGWKTAIKNIHWDASNMSQHKLCDDIAYRLSDFQDAISEVEQSLDGNLAKNELKPIQYEIKDLIKFIEDVISDTTDFYKGLEGDDYIGMRSECETFINDFQRFKYLAEFTLKEAYKAELKYKLHGVPKEFNSIVETIRDNIKYCVNEAIKKVCLKEDMVDDMIAKRTHEKYKLNNGNIVEMDLEEPSFTIWTQDGRIQSEYSGQKALDRIEYLVGLWQKKGGNFEDILSEIFR